jgi:hypothetical protein
LVVKNWVLTVNLGVCDLTVVNFVCLQQFSMCKVLKGVLFRQRIQKVELKQCYHDDICLMEFALFLHSFLLFIISLTISHKIWVTGFWRRNIHVANDFFDLGSQCLRVTLLLLRSPTGVVKLCSPHWIHSSRCNIFSCVFGCFVQPTEYYFALKYSKIKRAMPATQIDCQIMLVVLARFRGQSRFLQMIAV